ncbi:MAG: protein BatD [Magnetococcales bacterium]|nr:protein BatD [Magnetococcales bacterium]
MVTPFKKPAALIGLLAWILTFPLWAAEIQVRASREPVVQAESFSLIFSTADNPDGDPDFTPLSKDFEILDQGKSTNFQFINGHKSHSVTWTLELMPKHSGAVTIPPLAFGKDRSIPLTLNILPAKDPSATANPTPGDHPELLVEAETSNPTPYRLEQTLLTVRFLNAIPISGASMPEPRISSGDGVIEKLGNDQAYETERHGRRYLASERRYALFPQRSGPLTIDPIPVTVQLPGQGGNTLLKEFFNDPFIKNLPLGPGRPGQSVRLATQTIHLEAKAQPSSWPRSNAWLPAHRIMLTEKWSPDPPVFQVGEPVTRTLTLMADGLSAAQLEEIALQNPEGIKLYPDRPVLENQKEATGIIGKRIHTLALIPTTPGEHRLPAIELPWWNTDQQRQEVARLPERRITVLPAPGTATRPPESQTQPAPQPVPNPESRSVDPASGNRSAAATPETATPATPDRAPPAGATPPADASAPPTTAHLPTGTWPWVALVAGLGWMITGLLWWRGARRRQPPAAPPDNTRKAAGATEARQAEARLRAACLANDPQAARAALALLTLPEPTPMELADALGQLHATLYGPTPSPWPGERLWTAWQAARAPGAPASPSPTHPPILPPLYPS